MSEASIATRVARPELTLKLAIRGEGKAALLSPSVGLWRGAPQEGEVIAPGQALGELETLGVITLLRAPSSAAGLVLQVHGAREGRARRPVQYGDALVMLEWTAAASQLAATAQERAGARQDSGALVFCTPSSGRYYSRPAPGKAPFVEVGDVIAKGQAVALLEVMKTFNRLQYGGDGLPERVRVKRIVPADASDLAPGDVLLELEPE